MARERPSKLDRRLSSPMAPSFMVSAPGKVIVFGEHAVVYGKAAIAAAISLRTYLLVTSLSKSKRTITLVFPDIGLDHTWIIDDLPWDTFSHPSKKRRYFDSVISLDPELVQAIQPHIENVSLDLPEPQRKIHQNSASAFLYLFLSLSSPDATACIYTLRSTIPIGAGLGSSASVSVCIAAALLRQIHVLAGPHHDQPLDESEIQQERINKWAFVGELCIHGNPSGVDNTVASRGKAVLFKREDYSRPPTVKPIRKFPELPLLLVDTRHPKSTAVEVAKVAERRNKFPAITEQTLQSIDEVTKSAHQLIESQDFDPTSIANLEHLGTLFTMNHGHLVSLGVSHPKLEYIREVVDYSGIGWTKLTGAGGGGCAITLLKPNLDSPPSEDLDGRSTDSSDLAASLNTIDSLESKFIEAGYEQYKVTLGGDGVGVLYPAVLKNGTDDDMGGEEIDQQKFLNAEGSEGIERLVGVGLQEKRDAWKFWK
ncbi:MAG: hypothetical protein Q9160_006923 [Pyrenula sp. 1 TL-2023]